MVHFSQLRLSRLALNRKAREYVTKKCQGEHKASALAFWAGGAASGSSGEPDLQGSARGEAWAWHEQKGAAVLLPEARAGVALRLSL